MNYLILGDNSAQKDQQIAAIKSKVLAVAGASNFDYDVFYGVKTSPEELKKSLLSLPAISAHRLVIVRDADKLNAQNKDMITAFLAEEIKTTVLLLESEKWSSRDSFVKKITVFVKTFDYSAAEDVNVFDMTRVMGQGRAAEALKLLHQLIEDGNHPLQIMGGLVWFWGKEGKRVAQKNFERGLKALQEADLNIKRSRLDPVMTLEVLVIKLAALLR